MIRPDDADMLTLLMPEYDGEEFPQDIQDEYDVRIKFKHAVTTGPLGIDGLTGILRHLGYQPRVEDRKVTRIDWREVPQRTKVLVETEEGQRAGLFVDSIGDGILSVVFPDISEEDVQEYPSRMVHLVDEEDDAVVIPAEDMKGHEDRADLTRASYQPQMTGDWSDLIGGEQVYVEINDDILTAEFVEVGPHDNEISVFIEGHMTVVPEDTVTRAG